MILTLNFSSCDKFTPFLYSPKSTKRFTSSPPRIVSVSSASPESIPSPTIKSSEPISIPSPIIENSTKSPHPNFAFATSNGSPVGRFVQSAESNIERVIFDFRFLALLGVAGSLAGSVLCFLNGCVHIRDAYIVYWTGCVKGIHSGQMVLRLVEAIGDILSLPTEYRTLLYLLILIAYVFITHVYLVGTVMLIFAMGLYGLFISNVPHTVHPSSDRALQGSSLFGMFTLKERPKWMKISSLSELKTKVGHVIVMILLVKMFERSKMVTITTGLDLLSYSMCILLSSASLYILHNLHSSDE